MQQRAADIWPTAGPTGFSYAQGGEPELTDTVWKSVAFGLSGNWNRFEQNHSSRKTWLIIFISTLLPIMHFRVLKSYKEAVLPAPLI